MKYYIGIVGSGADKFTEETGLLAKQHIRDIIETLIEGNIGLTDLVIVSGHSPLGGIDIWAEEIANFLGLLKDIKAPKTQSWNGEYGYKQRNLDIARTSDIVHVIVPKIYPTTYKGPHYQTCYHCRNARPEHIKSGACWTAIQAIMLGKPASWRIIS